MMKLIDITRELLSAEVFPGDPVPKAKRLLKMEEGSEWNFSAIEMGLHSATHIDAPLHFYPQGKDAAEMSLERCFGAADVVEPDADITVKNLSKYVGEDTERLLLKGGFTVRAGAAAVLAERGIKLVGTERKTFGRADILTVHRELLAKDVVILESLNLKHVEPGRYTLMAFPLKIAGGEGSPVRAVLIKDETGEKQWPI